MTATMISWRVLVALLAFYRVANAQSPLPPPLPLVQTIPVSQFGAKGDGKTDDTKPFLAAISAAANNGAGLELENGTYLLTEPLRIPRRNPISISTAKETRLLFAPPNPLDTGILISNDSAVELKSFTIQGSLAGLDHGITMDILRTFGLTISGSKMFVERDLWDRSYYSGQDDRIWITNNTLSGVGRGRKARVCYMELLQDAFGTHLR